MEGKQIVQLAVDLAAGAITADLIKQQFGEGVLSSVLAVAGGAASGLLTNAALDIINNETGIVDDLGSLVDDVFSIF